MRFYNIVHNIAVRKGLSLENVSLKFGKTANYIYTQRSRGSSPTIDTASKLLSTLGYAICAIPNDSVPKNAYVISMPSNKDR